MVVVVLVIMCGKYFAYADVQGFKIDSDVFAAKEFCLIVDDIEFHDIVKSPIRYSELNNYYKRQANWVTDKHHGLKFDAGTVTLESLIKRTLKHIAGKTILVKGVEKVWWIKQIYAKYCDIKCVNIEYEDSFVTTLKNKAEIWSICPHHGQFQRYFDCRCALSNARSLRNFIVNTQTEYEKRNK